MPTTQKVIFELKSTHTGLTSRVLFWADYGVVIPELATTNGSFRETAQLVYGWVGCKLYTIENLKIPLDLSSQESLRYNLQRAYDRWTLSRCSEKLLKG